MPSSSNFSSLAGLPMEKRLAYVQKRFEDRWKLGRRPRIEKYLLMVPARERPLIFAILVTIDCEFRQKLGESASPTEYVDKYPYDSVILKEHLAAKDESDQPGAFTTEDFQKVSQHSLLEIEIHVPEDLSSLLVRSHPEKLGRYQIIKTIGQGGFGLVFQATDPNLGRDVAIKTLLPSRKAGATRDEKLLAEGRKVAKLEHSGIVRIYDADFDQGWHFLVTELLTGGTLADCLRAERYEWPDAALMIAEIADALQFAHEKGIVHRDLKPQNILIDGQGRPRIADFGMAATEEDQLHEVAGALGTYPYMPPEIAKGGGNIADERSDIYSLGCIFYQMLTDRTMFKANTPDQWRKCIVEKSPRSPRLIVKSIPENVEKICLKCLSKSPADRYVIASDLSKELRAVVTAHSAANLAQKAKPKSRNWPVTTAMGVLALSGIGLWAITHPAPKVTEIQQVQVPANLEVPDEPLVADPSKFPKGPGTLAFNEPMAAWEQLLAKKPNLLLWPDEKRGSSIQWDRNRFEVIVNSPTMSLVELGQTNQPNFDLQVCIQQSGWHGGMGVFLGYKEAPDFGAGHTRCLVMTIEKTGGDRRPVLNIWLEEMIISQAGENRSIGRMYLSGPHEMPKLNQPFLVQIRNYEISGVSWGTIQKSIKLSAALRPMPQNCAGRFGLMVAATAADFHKAYLKILREKDSQ